MVVSIENAEHYIWGDICDGWHLLKREDISIIQERVPPGATEAMHYHNTARQFFYILEGLRERVQSADCGSQDVDVRLMRFFEAPKVGALLFQVRVSFPVQLMIGIILIVGENHAHTR